jgi:hypothetical protein
MPSLRLPDRLRALGRGRRPRALSVAVATLFPLVGVVALGWNAAALLTLYWFELGIASGWALVRALFAGRPSAIERSGLLVGPLAQRRAGLSVPRTGVEIRASSLLVLPVAAPILAVLWAVVGTLTVGVVADGGLAPDALDTVTLAVLAVFVGEGATTLVEYFGRGEYRDHSAQTAIQWCSPAARRSSSARWSPSPSSPRAPWTATLPSPRSTPTRSGSRSCSGSSR